MKDEGQYWLHFEVVKRLDWFSSLAISEHYFASETWWFLGLLLLLAWSNGFKERRAENWINFAILVVHKSLSVFGRDFKDLEKKLKVLVTLFWNYSVYKLIFVTCTTEKWFVGRIWQFLKLLVWSKSFNEWKKQNCENMMDGSINFAIMG